MRDERSGERERRFRAECSTVATVDLPRENLLLHPAYLFSRKNKPIKIHGCCSKAFEKPSSRHCSDDGGGRKVGGKKDLPAIINGVVRAKLLQINFLAITCFVLQTNATKRKGVEQRKSCDITASAVTMLVMIERKHHATEPTR